MVDVVWLSLKDDTPPRGFWDQGLLEDLLRGFNHHTSTKGLKGAIVIVNARSHYEIWQEVNATIADLEWCLLILTGDEERVYPLDEIKHPNMKLWVQTPKLNDRADRFLPVGYPPQAKEFLPTEAPAKSLDYFFAGQITHFAREECVFALRGRENGYVVQTKGFTQGLAPEDYFNHMAKAKYIPCPSGPVTQDTFRAAEALEYGCIPLVLRDAYWDKLGMPVVQIDDWLEWPDVDANKVFADWQLYKRELKSGLLADLAELGGGVEADDISILMPTSPTHLHPDTSHILKTIEDTRVHLPHAEILLMIDGVRPEQEKFRDNYNEYLRRILWYTNQHNIAPFYYGTFHHQAAMTIKTLPHVDTPLLLFVEHDAPLTPDMEIDWEGLRKAILSGQVHTVRFHFETHVLDVHKHLMVGQPETIEGVQLWATRQWSQRPHLTSTAYYTKLITDNFTLKSRTMIEDKVHGVIETETPNYHKLFLYHPEGSIKRSYTLDSRGEDEPKYDMVF